MIFDPAQQIFAVTLVKLGIDPDKDVTWKVFPDNLLAVSVQKGEADALAHFDPQTFGWIRDEHLIEIANNQTGAVSSSHPVMPKLHAVTLPIRRSLLVPQKRIEAVYLIESGWVSMVAHLDEGTQAEVGFVGFEGMVGLPLVVGVDTTFTDPYMQASGFYNSDPA